MNGNRDIVIIGCGAGGGTAAQFARKTDRKSSITIFEKGKYPQYSKCGLPYTISGRIPDLMGLIEFPEEWFRKANIDLFLEANVEKIDAKKQIISAKKGGQIIEKPYSSLVICTGAEPYIPPIKNIDVKNVFVVRTIDDVKKIISHLGKNKKATVIGAGLIGLEMADNLHKKGLKVTIVEALPNILSHSLDEDMVKIILDKMPSDISIFTNYLATKVEDSNGEISKVIIKNQQTGDEKSVDTDILILATGIKPETSLAKSIGCKIGETGGIIVNEKAETSVKNVYAVGDCTEYPDFVTSKPVLVGLGSICVRQAIAAGINAAGGNYRLLKGVLQTHTSEFFGVDIATVGPTKIFLNDMSIISGKFNGMSLPDYFPGGKPISIKVLVDEYTGMIIGAQGVGENAAQRINMFACAILAGFDIDTFRKIETAYAPPIAPTLDVVTLVCDAVSMKLGRKKR